MGAKEQIRLRRRKMASGRTSLYLDIYTGGRRTYEYLHLYLEPEKSREDRRRNAETLRLAEAVCSKRIVELRNGLYGFGGASRGETLFYDYYMECVERRRAKTRSCWGSWRGVLGHIERYDPKIRGRRWSEITREWVRGFRDYLDREARAWGREPGLNDGEFPLSENSKMRYFQTLKTCCNQAVRDEVIQRNPCAGVEGFTGRDSTRMYLTLEEVRRLGVTPCRYGSVRRAFLFSCLTGLRRSDILSLTWGNVYEEGGFTRIIFRQRKTGGQEYLDIAPEAAELMGERGRDGDRVFPYFYGNAATNSTLRQWCAAAGINKDITFHCGRHTFATLMLSLGTPIYTVSKLLGHRELSTTQMYAKVLDADKRAAVAGIPHILGEDGRRQG